MSKLCCLCGREGHSANACPWARGAGSYVPSVTYIAEPAAHLIDALIDALRLSNGIEFCTENQVNALILELNKARPDIGAGLQPKTLLQLLTSVTGT